MQIQHKFNFDLNYLNTGCILQALRISWLVNRAFGPFTLVLTNASPWKCRSGGI